MKKVMIVVPQLYTGGVQKLAVDLASHIKDPRVEVMILSLKPRSGQIFERQADENGIHVTYLNKRSGMDLRVIPEIQRAIHAYRPDVIHANQRTVTYLFLPMILEKIPYRYYAVHNLADKDAKGIDRMVLKIANRFLRLRFIAISDLCRRSVEEVYRVKAEDVPCIYNGIDLHTFIRSEAYEDLNDNVIVFLSTGSFLPSKNKPLLISAFAKVHEEIPNTKLVLLGDGELRPRIETMVAEKNLREAVVFRGNVSDVARELSRAHIYVMSSDYEGLPVTILEAMAAGLPIISTKAGGVADVVKNEGNGILTEIGDEDGLAEAMKRLARDRRLRLRLAEHSRNMAGRFGIEAMAKEYVALYLHEDKPCLI